MDEPEAKEALTVSGSTREGVGEYTYTSDHPIVIGLKVACAEESLTSILVTSSTRDPERVPANHHTETPWYTFNLTVLAAGLAVGAGVVCTGGLVGFTVGAGVGFVVGTGVGAEVGFVVGAGVGGTGVGADVGFVVGAGVDGAGVGAEVGFVVGAGVAGAEVGLAVAPTGGAEVGLFGDAEEGGAAHTRVANETANCMSKYVVHLPSTRGTSTEITFKPSNNSPPGILITSFHRCI
jgi:hypothetical protein